MLGACREGRGDEKEAAEGRVQGSGLQTYEELTDLLISRKLHANCFFRYFSILLYFYIRQSESRIHLRITLIDPVMALAPIVQEQRDRFFRDPPRGSMGGSPTFSLWDGTRTRQHYSSIVHPIFR